MNDDLKRALTKQRKSKREVLELKELLANAKRLKNPDTKLIKMIEDEINARLSA